MGLFGEWMRAAPADLKPLRGDLTAVRKFIADGDGPRSGTEADWAGIDFLLRRRDFPVDIIFGEEPFAAPSAEDKEWDSDPPCYLTPAQVRTAAAVLRDLTAEEFVHGVTAAELRRAGLYHLYTPAALPALAARLPAVRDYFTRAAACGDAIICWLS
ncbi:hypothetical protein J2S43_003138 [Catenuloplanes nepalensis]|uniref:DUF1877 domain-containing protein n=1 Tax=Catenuloplanes nepalensis TaxID=587533 RepID=A0ABT9MTL9_9ACTN|nr:DUF1877 family protein [Catenuloplanes nepalensis]MDP9794626.1 hypothetical protein [Catenuloplanes nepalensis]